MKQKVVYIICAVVVIAAVAAALIFVFSGQGKAPEAQKPDLAGTWVAVAQYTNDTPVFTPGQFMVFADGKAAMYKDGNAEPFASSSYSINDANQLLLPDISREYKVDAKTQNCVRLYENTTTYMLLVRNSSDQPEKASVSASMLEGNWNVAMKGDMMNNGEVLSFSGNTMRYYKTPGAEPFATAEFTLQPTGELAAPTLNMDMYCYQVSQQVVMLVEQGGIVWELHLAQ